MAAETVFDFQIIMEGAFFKNLWFDSNPDWQNILKLLDSLHKSREAFKINVHLLRNFAGYKMI